MADKLRVTVTQLADEPEHLEADWLRLAAHVRETGSDLVLLPEMALVPWFARAAQFDAAVWAAALEAQARWTPRLGELAPAMVLGSRPVELERRRHNQAFVAEPGAAPQRAHEKYYLPDEAAFWEATWYERGSGQFVPAMAGPACVGFMLCTDLWFPEHARAYGQG